MLAISNIINKIKPILGYTFYQLLSSLCNLILSVAVVKKMGSEQWGDIVLLQLAYYLITTITAWGNKDYLLVQYNAWPNKISTFWQKSFITRGLFLLIPAVVICFLFMPSSTSMHLIIWVVCRFVAQSFESIVVYYKRYFWPVLAEFIPLVLTCIFWFDNTTEVYLDSVLWLLTISHVIRAAVVMMFYAKLLPGIFNNSVQLEQLTSSFFFALLAFAVFLQVKSDLYCMGYFGNSLQVGTYQILVSYLTLFAAVPTFLLMPFMAGIYQLNKAGISALHQKIILIGLFLVPFCTLVLVPVFDHFYQLAFSSWDYILAALYLLVPYFYTLKVYMLYKQGKSKTVLVFSLLAVAVNVVFCAVLIPILGITGAMVANVCAQVFIYLLYQFKSKSILEGIAHV